MTYDYDTYYKDYVKGTWTAYTLEIKDTHKGRMCPHCGEHISPLFDRIKDGYESDRVTVYQYNRNAVIVRYSADHKLSHIRRKVKKLYDEHGEWIGRIGVINSKEKDNSSEGWLYMRDDDRRDGIVEIDSYKGAPGGHGADVQHHFEEEHGIMIDTGRL